MSTHDTTYDEKHIASHDDQLIQTIQHNLAAGEISDAAVIAEGEDHITFYVWLLVACSSISGLLFGNATPNPIPYRVLITSYRLRYG